MDADTPILERFQAMRDEIVTEYDALSASLEELRARGKERSATFKQMMARKLTLATLLDIYRKHGLL